MRRLRGDSFTYITLICLVFWSGAAWATDLESPEARLTARFVPDSAPVGSMVDLALAYRLPKGAQLPSKPGIQGLEGLAVEGIQESSKSGSGEIRVRLLVDRLAEFKTGPLSLAYLTTEGKTEFLHTDPVALTILSNLGDRPEEAQIKPICGIIPTRSGLMKSLPWVLGSLFACAAGLGLLLWRRRRRAGGGRPRVQVPPYVSAEKALRELASQKIFEKGHVKEFYFRFSEILRRYLESLRGFPAAEYTTQEIALAIQAPEDRQLVVLLQDADLVKFADLKPTPAKKSDEVDQALAYIRETKSAFEKDPGDPGNQGRRWRFGRGPAILTPGAGP